MEFFGTMCGRLEKKLEQTLKRQQLYKAGVIIPKGHYSFFNIHFRFKELKSKTTEADPFLCAQIRERPPQFTHCHSVFPSLCCTACFLTRLDLTH